MSWQNAVFIGAVAFGAIVAGNFLLKKLGAGDLAI